MSLPRRDIQSLVHMVMGSKDSLVHPGPLVELIRKGNGYAGTRKGDKLKYLLASRR